MKIAFDATALGSGRGGDETLLRSLLAGLARVTPDDGMNRYVLYTRPGATLPPAVAAHPAFTARPMPWGPKPVRYAFTLPRLAMQEDPRPDLLYSQTHAPLLSPVPLAVQLTDMSYWHHPEFYPLATRLRLNLLLPIHAWQARVVLAPTEFSRQDFIRTYRLPPERVIVVPISLEPPTPHADAPEGQAAWLARYGITGPFVLYVGNMHPRKNIPRLIEAFTRARQASPALADYQLVLAGASWWHDGSAERAAQQAPPGAVVLTGRVTNEERDRLLRAAQVVAYPSIFEGFGLPPLEAMAAGTPVLASNVSSIPEVLGDAALLVDPLSVDALAHGLIRLAGDAGLRAQLRARGFVRAAVFTEQLVGERALAAFRWAVDSKATRTGRPELRQPRQSGGPL